MRPEVALGLHGCTGLSIMQYVAIDGVAHCQAKMLAGIGNCAEDVGAVGPQAAHEAARRLATAMAFVGIADYWNTSLALFQAQFGPVALPEHTHFRASKHISEREAALRQAAAAQLTEGSPGAGGPSLADDPLDTGVFHVALRIFHARLRAYAVEVPQSLAQAVRVTRPFAEAVGLGEAAVAHIVNSAGP